MGAAVADHGGKPLVDAALVLLGALVRVELNAGKVLLDGGILLGHGAELIILRAQGSVLRAQRFGLGTQRGQLIIGCIQRGTQGVALRRGVAVLLGEAVVFAAQGADLRAQLLLLCTELVDVALERLDAGGALRRGLLQFRDAMQSVAAALQAGYSMENAWRESEKEMTELYGQDGIFVGELHQINQAVGMNQPIEKLLYEFALRSDCEDIQNFSDVFLFAKRSGGDFHKIIATTIEHISDKIEVEREVQTVISAKKMEQKIMNVIPVFIILYLNLTSGEFLAPLYGNIFGISVMTGALGAYLAAIKISAKMTAIKV